MFTVVDKSWVHSDHHQFIKFSLFSLFRHHALNITTWHRHRHHTDADIYSRQPSLCKRQHSGIASLVRWIEQSTEKNKTNQNRSYDFQRIDNPAEHDIQIKIRIIASSCLPLCLAVPLTTTIYDHLPPRVFLPNAFFSHGVCALRVELPPSTLHIASPSGRIHPSFRIRRS